MAERDSELSDVLGRNIRALVQNRQEHQRRRSRASRFADAVTGFTGSMWGVAVHVLFFGSWFVINLGLTPLEPFDPYPFVMLAMWASVEAIFLSTFVLISQNRMSEEAERRAELDLQISLLSEHEVTRLVRLVSAMGERMGIQEAADPHLDELKQDIHPEKVMEQMERAQEESTHPRPDDH